MLSRETQKAVHKKQRYRKGCTKKGLRECVNNGCVVEKGLSFELSQTSDKGGDRPNQNGMCGDYDKGIGIG